MTNRLTNYKALSFDCYGTLIDWETGIWDAMQPLIMANGGNGPSRRQALNAYANLEQSQESATPQMLYTDILARVHNALARQFDLRTSDQLDADFGRSIAHWPSFGDTAEALRFLKTHFRLVILSNVSRDGIAASMRKLGVDFDAVYTAEDIGSYKPADANFEYLLAGLRDEFGVEKRDVLHTAQSLFHDHVPANKHGIANAWIDRQRLSKHGDPGATGSVDEMPTLEFRFFTMAEMADAVGVETG